MSKEQPGDPRDERLCALLRNWQAIEPGTDFEAAVWRRIRTASAVNLRTVSPIEALLEWVLPRPVWITAAAAVVAIAIGCVAGISSQTALSIGRDSEPLLHSRTLAGSYVAMTEGEIR